MPLSESFLLYLLGRLERGKIMSKGRVPVDYAKMDLLEAKLFDKKVKT